MTKREHELLVYFRKEKGREPKDAREFLDWIAETAGVKKGGKS